MTPRHTNTITALALLTLAAIAAQPVFALSGQNVPHVVQLSTDLGRVAANKPQTLTIVLKTHNQAAFDQKVEDLYNPESPSFHQWLSDADLEQYAPTAAEFETVKKELVKQGFAVVSSNPQRFTIRVTGTTANVETAFQTELHTLRYNGKIIQAHTRDAQLTGEAGTLVASVAGLDRRAVTPQISVAKNPKTGKPLSKTKVTAASGSSVLSTITSTILAPPALEVYRDGTAALPIGVYYGNLYHGTDTLTPSYTPAQLEQHYGLSSLIKQGYDGTGQTIALVEAYGYSGAESDANISASLFGLPPLTSKNFSVIYPEGKPVAGDAAAVLTGWDTEIALDIQSAHGIAPGAKILVVASSGQDNEDQIASLDYIITHKLASTVSNSWENDSEIVAGAAEENAFNSVLERGAAKGISFQFSTGDSGDQGLGSPVGALGVPSNSPYATAVGGTSILNNTAGSGQIVTGWGTSFAPLYDASAGGVDTTPAADAFFYGGAGGGESIFYPKPSWQKKLPGSGRQAPDVSALADPYTGFPIVLTESGSTYFIPGYGGTSLASPIFTAIWAIADQYNGAALGQAGPAVAKLKSGQILDVLPSNDLVPADVSGTVYTASGPTFYSATGLFSELLYSPTTFTSAILAPDNTIGYALTFGLDTSLTVTSGWDNVTGFGEPNGLPFIQGVSGKTKGAAFTK